LFKTINNALVFRFLYMFKKKQNNLDRYIDPMGEISNKELEISGWYVRHKHQLFNTLIGLLVVFNIITIVFSFWKWGEYALVGYNQDSQLLVQQLDEFPNYEIVHQIYGASDLKLSPTAVFQNSDGYYDFVSDVFNDNARWVAKVSYRFQFSSGETDLYEVKIMPNTKLPVSVFSFPVSGFPSSASIVIEGVEWTHIDAHQIPYIETYLSDRLSFSTSEFEFVYAGEGGLDASQIKFRVSNDTLFSYWAPSFYVDLLDGGQRVGVIYFTLSAMGSGETEVVDLRSFVEGIYVSEIELHPLVDVFDQNEFIL